MLSNALKFTPPGGQVTISTRRAGPKAVLRVSDTSIGIPALARAHGGQLTVASQPGPCATGPSCTSSSALGNIRA
jgi:signal transduction histidine kinase